ncbi:MAG: hypothetical protein IJ064_01270 [Bacteroidaceae bacterium]|nr:hypothetical protein [Bacteroidaceae bacterium]
MTKRTFLSLHPSVWVLHPDFPQLATFLATLPERFARGEGRLIYRGRNELREFEIDGQVYVVKSFHRANWLNRIVYGFLRKSKARRSYEYALLLRRLGIGSPTPVGYYADRHLGLFFHRSFYVCLRSALPYNYYDIIDRALSPTDEERYLRAIARTTAHLHDAGMVHLDYSQGNILFGPGPDGEAQVELIDLNRIRFHHVSLEAGCRNFADRLPTTLEQRRIVAEEYARVRGFDGGECLRMLTKAYERKD